MSTRFWCAALTSAAFLLGSVEPVGAIDPRSNPQPSSIPVSAALDPFAIGQGTGTSGSSIPVQPISTGGASTHTGLIPLPGIPVASQPQAGSTDSGRTRLAPGTPVGGSNPLLQPQLAPQPGLPTNPQQRRNRWRLGVYSTDTQTGVKIVEVVPNSPASRVGLEPNDAIVAVNGFQVGFVAGEHFDTGNEFDRLADDDGRVILLVHNHRNGQLVNVPVQLDSRFSMLTGTIGYRDRAQLPQDAQCTVELREITRAGAPPIALSSKTFAIRQIPIPFRLEYDPADIVPRRTYLVHATITSGGRQLYTTNQTYQVLNGTTNNQPLAMMVDPVVTAGPQVTSREAQLEEILRLYQAYLQRDPRQNEFDVLRARLERGQSLNDVRLDLLSGNEFYFRCDADNRQFINQLHQEFLRRPAEPAEMTYWLNRMDQHGGLRREVAREFLQAVGAHQS